MASQSDGSFTLRPATASDYKAVMDINRDLHEGLDYLPSLYFQFLQHSDIHMFVVTIKGRVVTFMGVWIKENGTEVLTFGARTLPEYQGHGFIHASEPELMFRLQKYITFPFVRTGVEKYRPSYHYETKQKTRKNYKFSRRWHNLVYIVSTQTVNLKLDKLDQSTTRSQEKDMVKHFDLDETIKLLGHPKTLELIRKDGDYIACLNTLEARRVTPETLLLLAKSSSRIQFTLGENEECKAILFGSELLLRDKYRSLRVDLHYYGLESLQHWRAHVFEYLNYLRKTTGACETYYLRLHFPIGMDPNNADKNMMPMLDQHHTGKTWKGTEMVCYTEKVAFPSAKL